VVVNVLEKNTAWNFTLQFEDIYFSEMLVLPSQSACLYNPQDCNVTMDKCSVTDFKNTFLKIWMYESHVNNLALLNHVDIGAQRKTA
jgi:hypothetical protein